MDHYGLRSLEDEDGATLLTLSTLGGVLQAVKISVEAWMEAFMVGGTWQGFGVLWLRSCKTLSSVTLYPCPHALGHRLRV